MSSKPSSKHELGELFSTIGGFTVLPPLMLVGGLAIWGTGAALGGDIMTVSHHPSIKPAFDMALNVQSAVSGAGWMVGCSALWGALAGATIQDISDLGTKFKNFGAGIVDFTAKVGQKVGLVKEGDTASKTLEEMKIPTQGSSYLARATSSFIQAAGVSAVAAGGLGIARIALDIPSLTTNPGTSSLAIGAAAAVGVGAALYMLGTEGLKKKQDTESIDVHMKPAIEPEPPVKKQPTSAALSPGE